MFCNSYIFALIGGPPCEFRSDTSTFKNISYDDDDDDYDNYDYNDYLGWIFFVYLI